MILHMDMDAFYASVEQLDNPHLKGKPVIVGSRSKRSVVSAASYEARRFGVRSAMPLYQAIQKCPQGIITPPRMERYRDVSKKIMPILDDFSPIVEPVSIDEAFVDITGCSSILGTLEETGKSIKKTIKARTGLTCSIGIAPNRFLAKIASDLDKPDGLTIIRPEEVQRFIETLPVQKVPGVGKNTLRQLDTMSIRLLGDVKKVPDEMIINRLGKFGERLVGLSQGIDKTKINPDSIPKSTSAEITLDKDTLDKTILKKCLLSQSNRVGRELRQMNYRAKRVTLKIKHSDFRLVTRSVTLTEPIESSEIIYRMAVEILEKYRLRKKVRLIGVGLSGFVPASGLIQMDIFSSIKQQNRKWEKVDRTVDSIIEKYGKDAVTRATLSGPPKKPKPHLE